MTDLHPHIEKITIYGALTPKKETGHNLGKIGFKNVPIENLHRLTVKILYCTLEGDFNKYIIILKIDYIHKCHQMCIFEEIPYLIVPIL